MRKIKLKPFSRREEDGEVERFFPDLSEEDDWFLKDEDVKLSDKILEGEVEDEEEQTIERN